MQSFQQQFTQLLTCSLIATAVMIGVTTAGYAADIAGAVDADDANTLDVKQSVSWDRLTPYAQQVNMTVLPTPDPTPMTEREVADFLHEKGTRSSSYLTVGLLLRDQMSDSRNATAIIRGIVQNQRIDPADPDSYGIWPSQPGGEKLDQNWREFVGVGLIVATREFGDQLPESVRDEVDVALLHAALGASLRDVSPGYTNIALMSAFLMAEVGYRHDCPELIEQGSKKAQAVYDLFQVHKTFTEYNSPTYYGIDLLGLGLWRKYGPSPTFQRLGSEIEADLWRDIAAFYHPTMRTLAGPHSRSYGMDMTQYVTPTGICIALAMAQDVERQDELKRITPTPEPGTGRSSFEWNYTPMFSVIRMVVPHSSMRKMFSIHESRQVDRKALNRDKMHEVRVVVQKRWMAGSITNLHRRWEQHITGTVHWLSEEAPTVQSADQSVAIIPAVSWLFVHGENGADCTIDGKTLKVRLSDPDPGFPLRIQLNQKKSSFHIDGDIWRMPGMTLRVKAPFSHPVLEEVDNPRIGRVLEVRFPIPIDMKPDTVVLSIEIDVHE